MSAIPARGAQVITSRDRGKQVQQWVFFGLCSLATLIVSIPVFVVTAYVFQKGFGAISWDFIFEGPKRDGIEGGFWPVIVLTIYSLILVAIISVPIGVMSAIYLSEYARPGKLLRAINLTIVNLAGVPSIVYGLFGAVLFLDVLEQDQTVLIASATLALQALAIIITSSREAMVAVPSGLREGCMAMGVSKLRTIFYITLPQSMQGIITGVLLAVSRAAGETAPIIVVGAILAKNVSLGPQAVGEERAQMLSFELYGRITEGLRMPDERKWGIAVVLLAIVLALNITALLLRMRIESKKAGSGNL